MDLTKQEPSTRPTRRRWRGVRRWVEVFALVGTVVASFFGGRVTVVASGGKPQPTITVTATTTTTATPQSSGSPSDTSGPGSLSGATDSASPSGSGVPGFSVYLADLNSIDYSDMSVDPVT